MILFLDTSALVKLYVREEFSDEVCVLAEEARVLAVSRISWAETMAALARRVREYPVDTEVIEAVRVQFRADWSSFAMIEFTQSLVELAGDYTDAFALRAYDSMQLAAARVLHEGANEAFCFACFDTRLQRAASILGMQTFGRQ